MTEETNQKINEEKPEEKKEITQKDKKKEKQKIKKEEAVARSLSLPISKKQAVYICKFIKNKEIDKAIENLNKVILFKMPVPFKGEIPHRKGEIMSGRYPIKASKLFINILKALKGNALVNGLELEKTRIVSASASWASRPRRSANRKAKRTHVILTAREFSGGKNERRI